VNSEPTQYFALPPYAATPVQVDRPDDLWFVANATGFNCLTFTDQPGAVFSSKARCLEIADAWNEKASAFNIKLKVKV
jgi:hypothetical protein